jgi:hypothetical protein
MLLAVRLMWIIWLSQVAVAVAVTLAEVVEQAVCLRILRAASPLLLKHIRLLLV